MSIGGGPPGPEQPEHVRLAHEARAIASRIQERILGFSGHIQLEFESDRGDHDMSALSRLSDELREVISDIDRAGVLYAQASDVALAAGNADAALRNRTRLERLGLAKRAVYEIWDRMAIQAVQRTAVNPRDQLFAVQISVNNMRDSLAMFNRQYGMMIMRRIQHRGISQRTREGFITQAREFTNRYLQLSDAVDRVREQTPGDESVRDLAVEVMKELHAVHNRLLEIEGDAVERGLIPNRFDGSDRE